MNVKAATLIYKNMVLPILEYGDIFLSAASKINRKRLQILQNRALRIANGVDRDTEIEDLHTQSKLMKLKTRRRQHLLQFIYNRKDDICAKRRINYAIRTRASLKNNLLVKKPNTEKFKKCAAYLGPKFWNTLPTHIQASENKFVFKNKLLKQLKRTPSHSLSSHLQ